MFHPVHAQILVLWDIDLTLLHPAGFGRRVIEPELSAFLGREVSTSMAFAGRTDKAILTEALREEGVDDPLAAGPDSRSPLTILMNAIAERAAREIDTLRSFGGGPLAGALETLGALDRLPHVHQGVVTGNMRPIAELKLAACGLDGFLDLTLGGFGDAHVDRADLVRLARSSALARGLDVDGASTVVIGDTVHDVAGAIHAGARAVGVATGHTDAAELRAAGAQAVLADLSDPQALVSVLPGASPKPVGPGLVPDSETR